MSFYTYDRYGGQHIYRSDADARAICEQLLRELRHEEHYPELDDEHTDVSLTCGDWAISVNVSGRVTLKNTAWVKSKNRRVAINSIPDLYMRDVPDEELVPLLYNLATGNHDSVLAAKWKTEDALASYVCDFYRQTQ